jgi:hypothetical protein
MATLEETVSYRVDDLDGTEEAGNVKLETIRFAIDGTEYEVDLRAANANKLRKALAPFVKVARTAGKSGGTASRRARGGRAGVKEDYSRADVREWAATAGGKAALKSAGVKAPGDRGRIASEVVALWKDAGSPSA